MYVWHFRVSLDPKRLTSVNSAAAELAELPENCALAARRSLPPCREATLLVGARCSVARWSRPRSVRVKNLRPQERSAHAPSDLRRRATSAAKRGALERTAEELFYVSVAPLTRGPRETSVLRTKAGGAARIFA